MRSTELTPSRAIHPPVTRRSIIPLRREATFYFQRNANGKGLEMYRLMEKVMGDYYRAAAIGLDRRSRDHGDTPHRLDRPITTNDVGRMLLACGAHQSLVFGSFFHALPDILLSDRHLEHVHKSRVYRSLSPSVRPPLSEPYVRYF